MVNSEVRFISKYRCIHRADRDTVILRNERVRTKEIMKVQHTTHSSDLACRTINYNTTRNVADPSEGEVERQ